MQAKDLIASLLLQCGSLSIVIWCLVQMLGKGVPFLRPIPQDIIALFLGPITTIGIHWFAPEWVGVGDIAGIKGYCAAGFLGLASVAVAGIGHDKIYEPAVALWTKMKSAP